MATVTLTLPHHRYEIRIEPGSLSKLGEWVRSVAPHDRAAIVADEKIITPHATIAQSSLSEHGYEILLAPVKGAEITKSLATVGLLYGKLADAHLERKSPIIALGGGVTGDTAGFVAATYLRGVPFIQCPTSLLAMVDSSVGGKVGVNLKQGKNLVGAFYHPRLVVIDTDTLSTLDDRELRCGLAECVKHAVIRDSSKFDWLETNLAKIQAKDSGTLVELVRWNVQIKANVVMADEKETGERAHLNFGHTFGHAIESTSGYGVYGHGEAVALGMLAATRLAVALGRCPADLPGRIGQLLQRIGLPTHAPDLAPTDQLMAAMRHDKKVADSKLRLVLPDRLGAVSIVSDAPDRAIADAWATLRQPLAT